MDTTDPARSASYIDIHLIRDLFSDVLTRMARRVPYVEQELLNYRISHPVVHIARFLFCFLCQQWFIFCSFAFSHCIVCQSLDFAN